MTKTIYFSLFGYSCVYCSHTQQDKVYKREARNRMIKRTVFALSFVIPVFASLTRRKMVTAGGLAVMPVSGWWCSASVCAVT